MSSHHIVRDEQEPALLLVNAEAISLPILQELLEWNPTVVVNVETLRYLLKNGIKADVLVYELEEKEKAEQLAQQQAPIKLVEQKPSEDFILAAFQYLQDKKHKAANIFVNAEQHFDLLFKLAQQSYMQDVVIFHGDRKFLLIRKDSFKKWYPAGEKLQLIPIEARTMVSTNGCVEDLEGKSVDQLLPLNTRSIGTVEIKADNPYWLIEGLH